MDHVYQILEPRATETEQWPHSTSVVGTAEVCVAESITARSTVLFNGMTYQLVSLTEIVLWIQISLLVVQSILLGNVTDYFAVDSPNATDTRNAYLYATGVVMAPLCFTLCAAWQLYNAYMSGMIVRIIASSAIYKKVMMQ